MTEATKAPEVKQGAGQPTVPGDDGLTDAQRAAAKAAEPATPLTGSGVPAPEATGDTATEVAREEAYKETVEKDSAPDESAEEQHANLAAGQPPTTDDVPPVVQTDDRRLGGKGGAQPVNHQVTQDNVTEPGKQKTIDAEGNATTHETVGSTGTVDDDEPAVEDAD